MDATQSHHDHRIAETIWQEAEEWRVCREEQEPGLADRPAGTEMMMLPSQGSHLVHLELC